jgi:hypothetical protein
MRSSRLSALLLALAADGLGVRGAGGRLGERDGGRRCGRGAGEQQCHA